MNKTFPTLRAVQVEDHPIRLNVCKSVESDDMNPRILKEPAGVAKPLSDVKSPGCQESPQ